MGSKPRRRRLIWLMLIGRCAHRVPDKSGDNHAGPKNTPGTLACSGMDARRTTRNERGLLSDHDFDTPVFCRPSAVNCLRWVGCRHDLWRLI